MTRGPIHLEIHDQAVRRTWYTCARRTSWVAGAFVAVISVVMLVAILREHHHDINAPAEIDRLKQEIAALRKAETPDEAKLEAVKVRLREADQRLRTYYFGQRSFLVHGAWLLLGGAIVLAVSAKAAADLGASAYVPTGPQPTPARLTFPMKVSLGSAGLVLAAFFFVMRAPVYSGTDFGDPRLAGVPGGGEGGARAGAANPQPTGGTEAPLPDAEYAKNWPGFRGPDGIAVASGTFPTSWDAPAGKNVAWKAAIPLPGHNSPVAWGDRVFVSGGSEEKREVYCFDAGSGALKWTRQVGPPGKGSVEEMSNDSGWATSTMATDGRRVFAIFPTGDLAAIDFAGNVAWSKSLGKLANPHAHASSLLVHGGLLIVQLDQGGEAKENLSAVIAFECATGKQAWKTARPVSASWSSPAVLLTASGPQLVLLGMPWIIAYEPKTGTEIWRAKWLPSEAEVAPSPTFADGMLCAVVDHGDLVTIRLDGKGDVTKSHMKKYEPDVLPDVVSPAALGSRVLLVATNGSVTLFDVKENKAVWGEDVAGPGFHASPVVVGKTAYMTDKKGLTHVIDLSGDAYKDVAQSPLGEDVHATPAFVGGRIFIRAPKTLYCIAEGANGTGTGAKPGGGAP